MHKANKGVTASTLFSQQKVYTTTFRFNMFILEFAYFWTNIPDDLWGLSDHDGYVGILVQN